MNTGEAEKDTGGKQGNQDGGKLEEGKIPLKHEQTTKTETFQNKRGSRFNIKIKGKTPNPQYIKTT